MTLPNSPVAAPLFPPEPSAYAGPARWASRADPPAPGGGAAGPNHLR